MGAALYEAYQGPMTIQNVKDPVPKKHGGIISVKAYGLCRSEWHGWVGRDAGIELPQVSARITLAS